VWNRSRLVNMRIVRSGNVSRLAVWDSQLLRHAVSVGSDELVRITCSQRLCQELSDIWRIKHIRHFTVQALEFAHLLECLFRYGLDLYFVSRKTECIYKNNKITLNYLPSHIWHPVSCVNIINWQILPNSESISYLLKNKIVAIDGYIYLFT
jgi:hypothetical protein